MPVHPLGNYTFEAKAMVSEQDRCMAHRYERLNREYKSTGMRRTVEAVSFSWDYEFEKWTVMSVVVLRCPQLREPVFTRVV
jgi:hypothetical protein